MPNRILREGILTSPKLAKLGWAEEVFYRRLMSVVDDFGRYHADHGLLRGHLYPRQLNKVSDSDIGKWLCACADAALVRVYPAQDGERYLEVLNFGQQVRAKKSKYPDPPANASECAQEPEDAHLDVSVFVSVSEDEKPPRTRVSSPPRPEEVSEQTWTDWLQLRKQKKAPVTPTVLASALAEADKAGLPLEDFLRIWCLRGSQGLQADWIKPQERAAFAAPQVASTVPSSDAERTRQMLDRQRMTPEEKAKADAVRRAVLSAIKPITREAA